VGMEVNFTVFRNVETGVALELVNVEDVHGLAGCVNLLSVPLCSLCLSVPPLHASRRHWSLACLEIGIKTPPHLLCAYRLLPHAIE